VEKAIAFIEQAGERGVDALAFPRASSRPTGLVALPASTVARSLDLAARLLHNSVDVPGPDVDAMCAPA
jgi:hypothetical protein